MFFPIIVRIVSNSVSNARAKPIHKTDSVSSRISLIAVMTAAFIDRFVCESVLSRPSPAAHKLLIAMVQYYYIFLFRVMTIDLNKK
ncbi:MAG: hypothetical protein CME93_04675 [Hyphomonadaceae bacterium]|nr:hypothetical protein [Hyphomonadaceae bacterium]OUX94669.1 MAG: hypothetical protein CBB77_06250 [Hyphomonas sp. TMED17]